MTHAIQIIRQEHRNYLALLQCLDGILQTAERLGSRADIGLLWSMISYIESFLDCYHHPKEDDYLFRALRRRCPEAGELLDALEAEHQAGYRMLAELNTALRRYETEGQAALPELRALASRYHRLEYDHMRKEEMEVLPLARRQLTVEDWTAIDEAFSGHDDPLFGPRRQAEFRKLYHKIVEMAPEPYGFAPPLQKGTA